VLLSHSVHFLYLDESGSTEPPDLGSNATPCMAIVGVIIDAALVPVLTREFLALKRRHFPHRFERGHALNHVLTEVKGSELLQMTRHSSRNKRRRALLLRSELLELLDRYGCRVLGRVWVKQPGVSLKPTETYTFAVQDIAVHFGQFLLEHKSQGLLIADARNQATNIEVAHSVFTQKWRTGGDPYPPLMEVPLFAHSDNHAGLQIADLVATTLVFPMAASAYGAPPSSVHCAGQYHGVRATHGQTLRNLQYRYVDETGRQRGGIVVSDPVNKLSNARLFEPPAQTSAHPGAALSRELGGEQI
jgi:hypothetical protein